MPGPARIIEMKPVLPITAARVADIPQHAHSASAPVNAHAGAEKLVLLPRQSLRQYVGDLLARWYVFQLQFSTSVFFPQEMITHINMLCARVESRVLRDGYGGLVVDEESG